jgi:hypothetical protein
MSSSFKWNQAGINAMVDQVMKDEATKLQRLMDQLGRQYKGRPVSVIKPALKRAFERDGGKITDPELTEYAEHISAGRHIKIKVG